MKIIFAFSVIFAACSNNNLPVSSHLNSLRVLNLTADQPEVAPGTTLTITPYISDAIGGGRALSYSASACPDPGIAQGVTPTCIGNPLVNTIATSLPVTLPGVANSYTGTVNAFSVVVPAGLLAGQSSINIYNGVNYLVTYNLTAADGTTTAAFRRIIVSQGHAINTNPSIADILVAGVSFVSMPAVVTSLLPSIPASASETYSYQDSSGVILMSTENLLLSWFTNAGDYQYLRTDSVSANQFTPGTTPPMTGHNTFVFVLRDGRGGEAILQRDF